MILDSSVDRNRVVLGMKANGIGVSIHYATPVPFMDYYKKKYGFVAGDFPNALNYSNQSISLPVHPKLGNSEIEYVCETLLRLIEH